MSLELFTALGTTWSLDTPLWAGSMQCLLVELDEANHFYVKYSKASFPHSLSEVLRYWCLLDLMDDVNVKHKDIL